MYIWASKSETNEKITTKEATRASAATAMTAVPFILAADRYASQRETPLVPRHNLCGWVCSATDLANS